MPATSADNLQDPGLFLAIEDLELSARGIVEGTMLGVHRSPFMGLSSEFEAHREYQVGDDLRRVNWQVWARTGEMFVKQYRNDTNVHLYLLVDASGSMATQNGPTAKWAWTARAAAALSFLALSCRDAAGLSVLRGGVADHVPARVAGGQFQRILAALESVKVGGQSDTAAALDEVAHLCPRRGIVAYFGDLFDDEEKTFRALATLCAMGHEVAVFHVLDPWEDELPEQGNWEFCDLETGEKIKVATPALRKAYNQKVGAWRAGIRARCEDLGIHHTACRTDRPIKEVLLDYLDARERGGGLMFVNALMLGGLGALAIPVIIHLIKSRRFQPAMIGTLRFLREALRETSARRRLHNLLLLFLRLLAVAALVLLFARPLWNSSQAPGDGQSLLVLVDASGSMNARSGDAGGPRHFELAARRIRQMAAQAGASARLRVWLVGDDIREAQALEVADGFSKVIPAGKADWAKAFTNASAALAQQAPEDRRLLVLTDMQKTDLPIDPAAAVPAWPAQAQVEVASLMSADWNAQVASVTQGKSGINGLELNVSVAVHGEAPKKASWPLEIWVDGKPVAQASVPAASGITSIALPASALQHSVGQSSVMAQVRLQSGDCLPEDNMAWLAVAPPHPLRVWLAGASGASRFEDDSYFLSKALGLDADQGEASAFKVIGAQVRDGKLQPADASAKGNGPEVVVLASCTPGTVSALPALAAQVKAGAGCVIFLDGRADQSVCAALAACGLLPAAPLPIATRPAQSVMGWDASHPAFARYDRDRLDLAALRLVLRHDLSPLVKAGAKPLMRLEDDSVAMVETACGKGRVLLVDASPTRRDSDWVAQRAFAPLARAWADCGSSGMNAAGWHAADRRFTDGAGFGPDLATQRILGFSETESDLASADEASWRSAWHLPAKSGTFDASRLAQKTPPPDGSTKPGELWPILALFLLFVLVIETLVADRRTV